MNKAWNKSLALLWVIIIILLGIYDAHSLSHQGKIQFDLLALLPQGKTEKMYLSKQFMEDGNLYGRLVIAFGHEEEEHSKRALQQFRDQMIAVKLPLLEHDIRQIEADYKNLFTHLYPYRAGLIAEEDRRSLLEGRTDQLVNKAISSIFSPFGAFSAAQIDTDPFGFYPRFASAFLSENSIQIDADSNLVIKSEGKFWYLYQGEITEKVFSLKLQEKISNSLQPILLQIEKEEGMEVLRFGAAFYASAGAHLAQSEISKISFISTLGIILLLLLIFRGPRPILLALSVVSGGLLCGLAACLYLFGSIHILALVFGCSLVGVAVDYALHYYCASFKPVDRFRILSFLLPAMPLGVLTSAIGYGALSLAPFPGIQQMAILACVGLVGSFISVSLWGPYFIQSGKRKIPPLAERCQEYLEKFSRLGSTNTLKPVLLVALLSIFCLGALNVTFDDNVRNFQSMDPLLKRQEERIKTLINFNQSPLFLAVNARSLESLLQTQEAITKELTTFGVTYKSLSDLIPSQKRQQENAQFKLEFCQSHFSKIADITGINSAFNPKEAGFDSEKWLVADVQLIKVLPTGWKELVHVAEEDWITGRILLNSPLKAGEIAHLSTALYIDPVNEYSLLFSSYREAMLLVAGGLLLSFALIISCSQGMRTALRITTPVVLSILTTVGVIGLSGIGFSMFHAMGLILVLCIGIDYALFLYWREPNDKDLLLLGNALAATTTLLSFGLLTLSTTASVHSFGITVFTGIVLNFFVTTLFLGSSRCKKF